MAKAKTEDIVKNILKTKSISEQEMNVIKRRLNAGEDVRGLEYSIYDGGIKLDKSQENKGIKWIKNQFRTPKGTERKNHPFGNREKDVIDNITGISFVGFHNASFWNKNFQPVYSVISRNNGFDYQLSGGKLEILG